VSTHTFARLAVQLTARLLVFFVLSFAEPHARAAAVFVDEFHASALKGADYGRKRRRIARSSCQNISPSLKSTE
jgi:hypothetical protein